MKWGKGTERVFSLPAPYRTKPHGQKFKGAPWPMPCPIGVSLKDLGLAEHQRWALACLMTGILQKELKSLRSQRGDVEVAHAVDTTSGAPSLPGDQHPVLSSSSKGLLGEKPEALECPS